MIGDEVRPKLHAYLVGILKNMRCPSLQTGGTVDHVHSLLLLARTKCVAAVVEEMKKSSSKWMKQQGTERFAWQAGYGAFSIGQSQADVMVRYIAGQTEHHRQLSFQDELRRLLDRYAVPYDERYLWD